jgi:hypothetical protein
MQLVVQWAKPTVNSLNATGFAGDTVRRYNPHTAEKAMQKTRDTMRLSIALLFLASCASAFVANPAQNRNHALAMASGNNLEMQSSRRGFLAGAGALTGAALFSKSALAIPMVTVDELGIILRDSPMSIRVVEFSGSKGETVIVRLVDGTSFAVKDVIESATEAMLTTAPKKKKMYTNQRVQEAAEKEREKAARMRLDEEERLEALSKMEQAE